jgi:hypothetical protein
MEEVRGSKQQQHEENRKMKPTIKSKQDQIAEIKNSGGRSICYAIEPDEEVQLLAVRNHGCAIKCIKNPSEKVKLAAVLEDGMAIAHIENPSEAVQLTAITQLPRAIRQIKNPARSVQIVAAAGKNGSGIRVKLDAEIGWLREEADYSNGPYHIRREKVREALENDNKVACDFEGGAG